MGHTTPPLRVGFDGVKGYAVPDKFEIDHHERVEVLAETKCSIRFEAHDIFDDIKCLDAGPHYWDPKIQDGTAKFDVGEYGRLPSPQTKSNRASKMRSGRDKK